MDDTLALPPAVSRKLTSIINGGYGVTNNFVEDRLRKMLNQLPEKAALDSLNEFEAAVRSAGERILNPPGYLLGVIRRMLDLQDKISAGVMALEDQPMGDEISPRVIQKLQYLSSSGFCTPDEVDDKCRDIFKQLSENGALAAIDELLQVDRSKIGNVSIFMTKVLKKYRGYVVPLGAQAQLNYVPPRQYGLDSRHASSFTAPSSIPAELLYGYGSEEYSPEMPKLFDGYGLLPAVEDKLEDIVRMKLCKAEDFEARILIDLAELPEEAAMGVLNEFAQCDLSTVRNVGAYLVGICRRLVRTYGELQGQTKQRYLYATHGASDLDPRERDRERDARHLSGGAQLHLRAEESGELVGLKRSRGSSEYSDYVSSGAHRLGGGGVPMEYGRPELAHVGGPLPVGSGFYPRVGGGAGNMMFDEVQHAALVVEMLSSLAPHEMTPRDRIELEVQKRIKAGLICNEDIEPHIRDFLATQHLRIAIKAIADYCTKDMNSINNKGAYLKGIVRKLSEKEEILFTSGNTSGSGGPDIGGRWD